jgi:monoamine oxidase
MIDEYEIVVVGAGVAGLAAARALATAGRRVALVEARDRVGGRIFTRDVAARGSGPMRVELGAEFIHGKPDNLWSIVREAALSTVERHGSRYRYAGGRLMPDTQDNSPAFEVLERMGAWAAALPPGRDASFAEYLAGTATAADVRAQATAYVEGFNAADRNVVSVRALVKQQQAEDAIDGDRLFHVVDGYDAIPRFLAERFESAGGCLRLGHPVRTIRWTRHAVSLGGWDAEGRDFDMRCRRAVITLPLGVLQEGTVQFDPAPMQVLTPARCLRMGRATRMTLLFRSRFWRDDMSFLFSAEERPPTWWTPFPDPAPMITAWAAGPNSAALEAEIGIDAAPDALARQCLHALAKIFRVAEADLDDLFVSSHAHDWQSDVYARGAYSYAAAGGIDASSIMAQPIERTLYFAGEHTDTTGHWGTVHAALGSGDRAAAQLLSD